MEVIQALFGIMALVCFLQYNHLKKNNIRFDELYPFYFGVFFLSVLIVSCFFETHDICRLFNW